MCDKRYVGSTGVACHHHEHMLNLVRFFAVPWTVVPHALLSVQFPWREYWSGLPFPPLGDGPEPGIEPASPILAYDEFRRKPAEDPQEEPVQDNRRLIKQISGSSGERAPFRCTSLDLVLFCAYFSMKKPRSSERGFFMMGGIRTLCHPRTVPT